ncbi:MAG TPA: adenosylcobinamide amidohydrolase [Bryobacteraceae bacterium]|nr:adenosylcobinamide amidohydrolase [Bryobacteraceae bacterium]
MNEIEFHGPLMVVRFPTPQVCVSWAIVNGGRVVAPAVAWYFIEPHEQPELVEPSEFLGSKLDAAGLAEAVGLITSRKRYGQVVQTAQHGNFRACCVATTGLSNALRIGDAPTYVPMGTINLLCQVSVPLSEECALEAIAMAAEARTTAVMDTSAPATGTGTDCIVIAYPLGGATAKYAGKHTQLGHVIGKAVFDAVHQGIKEWQSEHRP